MTPITSTISEGLAPYIISLGLFVGALAFSIFFPMRETLLTPTSGLAWFFSKYSVAAAVAILQAIFICTILLAGIGLEVASVWRFYLFAIITSLSFFALVQWLTTAFGNGGRMISGLLLLIQFGGSSGAFPVALTPAFYQWVHAFLPMTYSVKGLRQIISIGIDDRYLGVQSLILISIAIASMILTWVTFVFLRKRNIQGKPNISANNNLPING
ncbi:YhgE/Pip family protein [Terrilactibacillus sp. S3-3]|nr:YhgE/Pip family protein [Terrilactibacillus sp. S3-3]